MNNVARSLNVLTALLGGREIERLDGQVALSYLANPLPPHDAPVDGPWVCVDFSDGSKFAIWKTTGAIYRIGPTGAVEDDPFVAWREDGAPVVGGVEL